MGLFVRVRLQAGDWPMTIAHDLWWKQTYMGGKGPNRILPVSAQFVESESLHKFDGCDHAEQREVIGLVEGP